MTDEKATNMSETKSLEERIAKLEEMIFKLSSALYRKDTEQDGNWGWPPCRQELKEIMREYNPALADKHWK